MQRRPRYRGRPRTRCRCARRPAVTGGPGSPEKPNRTARVARRVAGRWAAGVSAGALGDGRLDLGRADGAFDPGPDHAGPVDDDRERLRRQLPLVAPAIRAVRRVVALVDLDVDEVDTLALP